MALAQFDSLLWNRQFLVVLVHMAENDQSITASERSTLSSLLIVALSRNMVYCTDAILLLLSEHIERNANVSSNALHPALKGTMITVLEQEPASSLPSVGKSRGEALPTLANDLPLFLSAKPHGTRTQLLRAL